MRVSSNMMSSVVLRNIFANAGRMQTSFEQGTTGYKIVRPSDDPISTTLIMSMKSIMSEQTQHLKNMDDGIGWLDATDEALEHAGEVMKRAYELAMQGANGTMSEDSKKSIGYEIDQLIDEMIQVGNTSYAGRYIFAGTRTTALPFEKQADGTVDYVGNDGTDGELKWEIGPSISLKMNIDGRELLDVDGADKSKVIEILQNLKKSLDGSDPSLKPGDYIDGLQEYADSFVNLRAVTGSKSKRLEMATSRTEAVNFQLKGVTSKMQDADLSEVSMNYAMQEAVYNASLMMGARVIQPSLLQFLR